MGFTMGHINHTKLALSLNDPSIRSITFIDGEVDDLEFLRGNTFVRDVYISNCNVKSLDPLEDNATITILRIVSCRKLESLEPLRHNTTIHTLDVLRCNLKSLEPLRHNTTIHTLDVRGNHIVDVSPLEGNCTIKRLDLAENPIVDVSPIESMRSLEWLTVYNCRIQDADPIFRNQTIRLVDMSDNRIASIDLIRFNTTLDTLYVRNNPISEEHKLLVLSNAYLTDVAFEDEEEDEDRVMWTHLELNDDNLHYRRLTLKILSLCNLRSPKRVLATHIFEKVDLN